MIHIDCNYLHAIIGISLRFSHFSLILSILSIFTLNKKLREYLDIKEYCRYHYQSRFDIINHEYGIIVIDSLATLILI
ncbi:unnamed protein product [Rhizophagus irregularis]|nr:unnamed protein product [Rhizophagus irregularis]CAB5384987.1 unnamed protein product [Rhizophagus irregularis]